MKRNLIRKIGLIITASMFVFTGCANWDFTPRPSPVPAPQSNDPDNPSWYADRAATLDALFDVNVVSQAAIKISRDQWNTLCTNFDQMYENEECVHCDFVLNKSGKTWKMKDVGLRLRGNTTRVRPQGPDRYKAIPRNSWEDGTLAQQSGYRQAHFKVNFEKFKEKDVDYKIAGFAKGINLKRFNSDTQYGREMLCYDLFRHYGIVAPRASYTHLTVEITEDNGTVTELDYGMYEMFEDLGKQFVKSYEKKWGDFNSETCFLFKCGGGSDLLNSSDVKSKIGEDDINFETKVAAKYTYSIKEGKKKAATNRMLKFIQELNALDNSTDAGRAASKAWFEKQMDVDYFLKSLAVSVITGMDDDYWANANNWYAYFDANDKFWWIPYDYDNTIGHSIKHNPEPYDRSPFEWHLTAENGKAPLEYGKRPLIEKMLEIPEFKAIYRKWLLQISGDSYTLYAMSRLHGWQDKIRGYVGSTDLVWDNDTYDTVAPWDWGNPETHFAAMRQNIINWCVSRTIIFDLNGGNIAGNTNNVVKSGDDAKGLLSQICADPVNGDRFFKGWTLTKNGNDIVTGIDSEDEEVTVYAKWVDSIIEPATIDAAGVHFRFVPEDWGKTAVSNVYCVGWDFDGGRGDGQWTCDEAHKMTKNSDGVFVLDKPLDSVFGTEFTGQFRFVVDNDWIATENYKYIECCKILKSWITSENYIEDIGREDPVRGDFKFCEVRVIVDGAGNFLRYDSGPYFSRETDRYSEMRFEVYEWQEDWLNPVLDGKKIYWSKNGVDQGIYRRNGSILAIPGTVVDLSQYVLRCEGKTFKGWYIWGSDNPVTTITVDDYCPVIYARWE